MNFSINSQRSMNQYLKLSTLYKYSYVFISYLPLKFNFYDNYIEYINVATIIIGGLIICFFSNIWIHPGFEPRQL